MTTGQHGTPDPGTPPAPLVEERLRRAVVGRDGPWRQLRVLPQVPSTNSALLAEARDGAPPGTVLVTEHQTAGRGRLDRTFETPSCAALTLSVLLRPAVPPGQFGWLPLLAGVAVVRVVSGSAGLPAMLKWPNDVLLPDESGPRKLVGILSEGVATDAGIGVVLGIGMNVTQSRDQLAETATSLAIAGGTTLDRETLLLRLLDELAGLYTAWSTAGGNAVSCGLAAEYAEHCHTLGQRVRLELPTGTPATGRAVGVDTAGQLQLRAGDGTLTTHSAGDVVHLRPDSGGPASPV